MTRVDKLSSVFAPGAINRSNPPAPPVEGIVVDVTAAGLRFTIAAYDGGVHLFGPAPYPTGAASPVGMRCVAVFTGPGMTQPWVVGLWP